MQVGIQYGDRGGVVDLHAAGVETVLRRRRRPDGSGSEYSECAESEADDVGADGADGADGGEVAAGLLAGGGAAYPMPRLSFC